MWWYRSRTAWPWRSDEENSAPGRSTDSGSFEYHRASSGTCGSPRFLTTTLTFPVAGSVSGAVARAFTVIVWEMPARNSVIGGNVKAQFPACAVITRVWSAPRTAPSTVEANAGAPETATCSV